MTLRSAPGTSAGARRRLTNAATAANILGRQRQGDGGAVRYARVEDILSLALKMQGTSEGVSLGDIEREFGVKRSTAERMRNAVQRAFPQAEEVPTGERVKRWRLPGGTVNGLIALSAEDLASLAGAAKVLRRENLHARARALEGIAEKVQALMQRRDSARVAPDLEVLVEAEGLAMRPGPRPKIDDAVLATLRQAILATRKVRLHYRARGTGVLSQQLVCPYGFLYGGRHYLVAYSMGMRGYRLFCLSNIEKAEETKWPFPRHQFSLAEFAQRSFGVFQGEPFDVVWEFSKRAAPEAREFHFHPTEKKTRLPGGRLRVSFRASGALEMSWHLAMWRKEVRVVKPRDFKRRVTMEKRAYWSFEDRETAK